MHSYEASYSNFWRHTNVDNVDLDMLVHAGNFRELIFTYIRSSFISPIIYHAKLELTFIQVI